MDKESNPIECAIREVKEEVGIILSKKDVVLLNKWYPSAGYMTETKHVLVGFFDSQSYNSKQKYGLETENEEIYTELLDIDVLKMMHVIPNGLIFSPEISAALLYVEYFKNKF